MAYRKVNDNSLVSVADAIRSKGGTSDALVFPDGFVSAISAIQTGGGGAKETWVIKSDAAGEFATTQIAFTSNGQKFTSIGAEYSAGSFIILRYDNNEVAGYDTAGGGGVYEFDNEAYRKLTFDTPPTGALLTWLQANGVKQPDDTAVQDTKAVTITSNGTVSVTPDAPYDGLSSVDVTVNVSGGGGSSGGRLEYLNLSDTSFGMTIIDVSLFWCDFINVSCNFIDSSNVTFNNCRFLNSEIDCTQEIYDAIVNGEHNSYSTSSFNIV